MFFHEAKVFPVIDSSTSLEINSYVFINNPDDDMHNQKGTFKGHYEHVDGIMHSLIILEGTNKNFYTLSHTLERVKD
jgi:hypothetical protein